MNNIETIRNFVNQRPGFCSANYWGNNQGYRRDQAAARNQKKAALELLDLAESLGVEFDDNTPGWMRGRFFLENGQAQYHCGQYYPTEYRGQVAAFVARHVRSQIPGVDAMKMSRNARAYW